MTASVYHLQVEPGAALGFTATVTNPDGSIFNLTGYTLSAQARTTSGQLMLDLSSYLTNGGAAGTVTVNVPASATASIPGQQGLSVQTGNWDLLATSGSTVYRLLAGNTYVVGRTTR